MRLALLGTFLFLLAVSAQAERGVRVVIGSIGSATSDSFHDPDASTPSVQIARELMNRLGYRQPIELVPFARAVNETQRSDNIVMIPLARTPRRENKYQWLNLLWEDDCVLVRAADKGNTDISKIGVVRASATEEVAEILGLANVELSTDDIQNALKLASGRIDAWFSVRHRAEGAIRAAGMDPEQFVFSSSLKRISIYVAASLRLDPAEAARWTAAANDIHSDGTLTSILAGGGVY